MKGIAKPSPIYFSAYPLKALEQSAVSSKEPSSSSPYLRSVLTGKTKIVSRARVFPMINPYKNPYPAEVNLSPIERIMMKHTPEETGFRNYE
jgi:hypothetical protein